MHNASLGTSAALYRLWGEQPFACACWKERRRKGSYASATLSRRDTDARLGYIATSGIAGDRASLVSPVVVRTVRSAWLAWTVRRASPIVFRQAALRDKYALVLLRISPFAERSSVKTVSRPLARRGKYV